MLLDEITNALHDALSSIVPKEVGLSCLEIPKTVQFEFEEEAKLVQQAGNYRQREFSAGRDCARGALASIGCQIGPMLIDTDGLPRWPEGTVGSISHSRGYCAAVAAVSTSYLSLGLDLEKTNRLSRGAISRVVHSLEESYVKDDQQRASLIFCAKEAFFKLQYPVWHTSANFDDIALAIDPTDGTGRIVYMAERFPEDLRALTDQVRFRFMFFGDYVVSLFWISK